MFRSIGLLIVLACCIAIVAMSMPASAVTWSLVSSYATSYTLATPDDTNDPVTHAKFSSTVSLPSELVPSSGFMPNTKVTFRLNLDGVSGWGMQRAGQCGLALFVGPTPDPTIGVYSGVHYEGYSDHGALVATAARSANPGGTALADETGFDGEIDIVNGVATTTLIGANTGTTTQTVTLLSSDITNYVGKSQFAAFKAQGLSGDYNYQYGRAFLLNLKFYRDLDQTPPQGTVSGSVHLNGTTPAAGAWVGTTDSAYFTTADSVGNYTMPIAPGTYTMVAKFPGYADNQVSNVVIQNAQTTTQNFKLAGGILAGSVTVNGSAAAGAGATVRTQDSLYTTTANSSGAFSLRLPPGTYTMVSSLLGTYADVTQSNVVVSDETTTNVTLAMTGPNWVQVSADGGPYVTPPVTLTAPGFSPTYGTMPSALNVVGTWLPNMKVTYHIENAPPEGYGGWGGAAAGFGGLALFGDASNVSLGLFSGIWGGNNGSNWTSAPLVQSTSAAGGQPTTVQLASAADVTLVMVSGVAGVEDSVHPGVRSVYNVTANDIQNWAGNSKYAAFRGTNNSFWAYIRSTISNITFYKDTNQPLPPKGTISGNVTMNFGTSHPAAVGASVTIAGDGSTTTDSAGFYTMDIAPGTYSITVAKANCDSVTTNNIVVTDHQTSTVNFDLPTSFITGHVNRSIPAGVALTGVSVRTLDGLASTVTDTAGNYSLQVHSGSYKVKAYKYGFLSDTRNVTVGSNAAMTQNFTLGSGWDLADDFTTINPNNAWSYAYNCGTAVNKLMTRRPAYGIAPTPSVSWGPPQNTLDSTGTGIPWDQLPAFAKNLATTAVIGTDNTVSFNWEQEKLCTTSGMASGTNTAASLSIARFTAPTSGYYNISARWAGENINGSTNAQAALRYQGIFYLFGDPATSPQVVSGFAGRASNNFTDATGTAPVLTFNMDLEIHTGETIEAVTTYPNNGWAQLDLTIKPSDQTAYVQGHVTSNLPGQQGIPYATVIAYDGPGTYQVTTDSTGYYVIAVQPGSYTVEGSGSGYNAIAVSLNLQPGTLTNQDFALTHRGTWNLAADFAPGFNPNGQWSYGWTSGGYIVNPMDQMYSLFGNLDYYLPGYVTPANSMQAFMDPNHQNPWYCWIGKNTTGGPVTWSISGESVVVNNNELSYGGGGSWFNSGPQAILPRIRWTSPDYRLVKVNVSIRSQIATLPNGGQATLTIAKNNVTNIAKTVAGFAGSANVAYADSIGPAPIATFETQFLVSTGDTIDFMQGKEGAPGVTSGWNPWFAFGYPPKSMGLTVVISPGDATLCNTLADVKSKPANTVVYLTNPAQLACAMDTYSDYSFFVQSDDRAFGMKCLGNADLPVYDETSKIAFIGKIVLDSSGQKVVQVTSVVGSLPGTAKPLGVISKAISTSPSTLNKLVKITGKLMSTNPADIGPGPFGDANPRPWNYWIINDGGQDVKVMMNTQTKWMAPPNIEAIIGNVYSVTGVLTLDSGGQPVLMPFKDLSFTNWTTFGL